MYKVIIEADHNDGDYITSEHEIEDEDSGMTRGLIERVAAALNKVEDDNKEAMKKSGHKYYRACSWPMNERSCSEESPTTIYGHLLSEEDIELFSECCPYDEYGIHTIESIRIIKVVEDLELLDKD